MSIEYKAVPLSGYSEVDPDNGIVETLVSVTGIVDNVNDIIEPGAYAKSLEVRTPKGIWSHDWNQPLSRTLDVKELLPGDPDLPATLPDGSPWPREAGALKVRAEFNLKTTRGRDAYEDVKFFGDSQEWSIGYNVPVGGARLDSKTGIRHITTLDLYEYSPVLFGAMPLARTTSVKSAQVAYKSLMEANFHKGDGRGDTRWGDGDSEIPGDDENVNLTSEQINVLRDALPIIESLVGNANHGAATGTPTPRFGAPVPSGTQTPVKEASEEGGDEGTNGPDISVDGNATAVTLVAEAFPDNSEIAEVAQRFEDATTEEDTEDSADIILNAIEDTSDTLTDEDGEQRQALARLAVYIASATTPTDDAGDAGDTPAPDAEQEEKVLIDMSEFEDILAR